VQQSLQRDVELRGRIGLLQEAATGNETPGHATGEQRVVAQVIHDPSEILEDERIIFDDEDYGHQDCG
jgi:hypothetical protein